MNMFMYLIDKIKQLIQEIHQKNHKFYLKEHLLEKQLKKKKIYKLVTNIKQKPNYNFKIKVLNQVKVLDWRI